MFVVHLFSTKTPSLYFYKFLTTGFILILIYYVFSRYVWEHLDVGYMQGMCDLVAPLLVIFDDESLSYGCFCRFMERMIKNFPNGVAMDRHFTNMRYDRETKFQ